MLFQNFSILVYILATSSILCAQNNSKFVIAGTCTEHIFQNTECIPKEQRERVDSEIKGTLSLLKSKNKGITPSPQATVLFGWPLKAKAGFNDPGYHSVSAFADHDTTTLLKDYDCGTRTYDGHGGTDYFLWPFSWNKVDSSEVEIVAAAKGVIISKADGNFDLSCGGNKLDANEVILLHSDSSRSLYWHMKKGSVTTKSIGDTVQAGEYLGTIGSSGQTSGPHLHFEVYDGSNKLVDPYQGNCNNFNNNSWWTNQRPYVDAGINRLRTNSRPPEFKLCPDEDITNESDYFASGDTIDLCLYYRNLSPGDSTYITITRPDSSIWGSWPWVHPTTGSYFNGAFMWFQIPAGSATMLGTWKFQADYKNQTYAHLFHVVDDLGYSADPKSEMTVRCFPNPFASSTTVYLSKFDLHNSYSLSLLDLYGQEIRNTPIKGAETIVQKDGLSAGIYFCKIYSNNVLLASRKIIVQ